jgi:hypothetical protein
MSDKQNLDCREDRSSPADDEESARQRVETPRSYYYDDATGYEIYEEATDTDADAEDSETEVE